jgi:hypothetical protein
LGFHWTISEVEFDPNGDIDAWIKGYSEVEPPKSKGPQVAVSETCRIKIDKRAFGK